MRTLFTGLCLLFMVLFVRAQEHYRIVFLFPNSSSEVIGPDLADSLHKQHLANNDSLWLIGDLLASGPLEGGGGIMIFHDFSEEHVEEILESDPAIRAGIFTVEHHTVVVPIGSICPVGRDYKMTDYSYIRFESSQQFEIEADPEIIKDHMIYVESRPEHLDLKFMGWFAGSPGNGIMVLRDSMSRELSDWIDGDPLIETGSATYTFFRLDMAEGIFCEF